MKGTPKIWTRRSGQPKDTWRVLLTLEEQPEILAKLNVGVARILNSKALPAEAIPYFIRAASYNSSVKNSAQTYADLANAYEQGPYERLAEDYRNRFGRKRDTK